MQLKEGYNRFTAGFEHQPVRNLDKQFTTCAFLVHYASGRQPVGTYTYMLTRPTTAGDAHYWKSRTSMAANSYIT